MNGTPSHSTYDENSQSVSSQDKIYQFLNSLSAEEKAQAMKFLSNQRENNSQSQQLQTQTQPQPQYFMQPAPQTYQYPMTYIPKNQIQPNPYTLNLAPPEQQFSQINHPAFNKNYIT